MLMTSVIARGSYSMQIFYTSLNTDHPVVFVFHLARWRQNYDDLMVVVLERPKERQAGLTFISRQQ